MTVQIWQDKGYLQCLEYTFTEPGNRLRVRDAMRVRFDIGGGTLWGTKPYVMWLRPRQFADSLHSEDQHHEPREDTTGKVGNTVSALRPYGGDEQRRRESLSLTKREE